MKRRAIFRAPGTWAILFAMAVTVMFYFRSVDHVCVGDELRYFYKFNLQPGENYFNFNGLQAVHSVPDIWDSQVNHYLTVNGRSIIHATEQLFSGVIGLKWFYVINTFVFLLTVQLFERVTAVGWRRNKPMAYTLCLIIFLYLFPVPGRLWLSVNLALNYLWPSCLGLGWIIIFGKIRSGASYGWIGNVGIILLSFLLGWSNEAFSLPLSGGIGVWMLLNIKTFRRSILWAVVPLWIGSIVMICSPGNWIRAGSSVEHIQTFFSILLQLKLFWILILSVAIVSVVRFRYVIKYICTDYILWVALALALGMGVVAHTAVRAFTAIELFSAIILVRWIRSRSYRISRFVTASVVLLACVVLIHQMMVTREHRRQYTAIADTIRAYQASTDGTVKYDFTEPEMWLSPFVYYQIPTSEGADYEWRLLGIARSGSSAKPFTALRTSDYAALSGLPEEADSSSSLYPFSIVGNSYFAVYRKGLPGRYNVTLDDGKSETMSRRLFSHGGRTYMMLIPPEGRRIIGVEPVKK